MGDLEEKVSSLSRQYNYKCVFSGISEDEEEEEGGGFVYPEYDEEQVRQRRPAALRNINIQEDIGGAAEFANA